MNKHVRSSKWLGLLAAAWLSTAAMGCDKPTPAECKKAINNIRVVLGTSQQSEFGSASAAWVRSCRGSAKRKAVKCAIESATVDALKGCGLISAKEIDELIELDKQLQQLNPPLGSGSGSGAATGSGAAGMDPALGNLPGPASGSGLGSGSAAGTGTGSASGTGTGSATGAGTGTGTGSATGAGTGTGSPSGTGTGTGSASGTGAATGSGAAPGSAAGTPPRSP